MKPKELEISQRLLWRVQDLRGINLQHSDEDVRALAHSVFGRAHSDRKKFLEEHSDAMIKEAITRFKKWKTRELRRTLKQLRAMGIDTKGL